VASTVESVEVEPVASGQRRASKTPGPARAQRSASKSSAPARVLSPALARRLAIARQRLAGPRPPADAAGILEVARDLGCLQLDPISAVARSHLLVLQSRLGPYDPAHLDALLWRERRLFEYWGHAASIVLTEDYPFHSPMMRAYATADSGWGRRLRAWAEENATLREHILDRLRDEGPLPSKRFEAEAVSGWLSTGWTAGRNVSRMLDFLWIKGQIMVAGRAGGQKLWDLTERCLPAWTPTEPLPERELVRQAAQRSLRALGVARAAHLGQHFIRGRYPGLAGALADLEAEGRIVRVQIAEGQGAGRPWPGPWYVHRDDLPLLDRLEAGDWQPRTTLLSPFDNLICDRKRTETLFGFQFRIEIYVPKEKRLYGYYVLPILHGDRLIGRVDPVFDRKRRRLTVNAVYAEPDAPATSAAAKAVAGAIEELGRFLGAREIALCPERAPAGWAQALRRLAA